MAKLPQSSFALDFLRRLLCAHTAPGGDNAARRDDGADAAALLREKAYEGASPARSPCIVARLMGLDAMPTPARDQQQTPTLRRSRSASSAEGLSPPPPTPCCSPRPRVARTTSASFGDRPTYLRRENDEFLLLSFSPDDAGDDDDLSACFSPASRGRADALVPGRKQRRRRRHGESGRSRRQAAKAEECGTENSSPVSVLDAQEESSATATTSSSSSSSTEEAEQCSPTSDGEEIRLAPRQEQGSRRKLPQPPFEDLGGRLPPEVVSTCRVSDYSGRDRKAVNNAEVAAPAATGIWRTICRLVEDDICGMKWGGRDDANIAAEMESAILEQLICEETEELVQLTVV